MPRDFAALPLAGPPPAMAGSVAFSSTLSSGSRWYVWKTKPICDARIDVHLCEIDILSKKGGFFPSTRLLP